MFNLIFIFLHKPQCQHMTVIWGTYVNAACSLIDTLLIFKAFYMHWMCNRMATDPLSWITLCSCSLLRRVRLSAAPRTAAHHESEQTPGDGEGQSSLDTATNKELDTAE